MKKALSVLMVFCLLFSVFSIYSSAAVIADGEYTTTEMGSINTCVYDIENKKVIISGYIDHDFFD